MSIPNKNEFDSSQKIQEREDNALNTECTSKTFDSTIDSVPKNFDSDANFTENQIITSDSPHLEIVNRKKKVIKDTSSIILNVNISPIWLLLTILTCFVTCVTLIFHFSTLTNFIALKTMSPQHYYRKVEKRSLHPSISSLAALYHNGLSLYEKQMSKGVSQKSEIILELSDILFENLGLQQYNSINQMEFEVHSSVKDFTTSSTTTFSLNDTNLISLFSYYDLPNNKLAFQIPSLSDAYLTSNISSLGGIEKKQLENTIELFINHNPLTKQLLESILTRYTSVLIDEVTDVTLEKNFPITLGNLKDNTTKISLSFTEYDIYKIALSILHMAKEDTELAQLYIDFQICTKSEFRSYIDLLIMYISSYQETDNTTAIFTIDLTVNPKGMITGRMITINSFPNVVQIGYQTIQKKNCLSYHIYLRKNNDSLIEIAGSSTYRNKCFSGQASIDFNSTPTDSYSIEVDYTNLKIIHSALGYLSGTINFTAPNSNRNSLTLNLDATKTSQTITAILLESNQELLKIHCSESRMPFESIIVPNYSLSPTFDIETELEQYISNADIEQFLFELKKRFNINFSKFV